MTLIPHEQDADKTGHSETEPHKKDGASARVILIGNGPSATQNKLGEVIDSYDIVVRFNCWRTEGFEDCLGSRCDVWALNLSPHDTEKFISQQSKKRKPGQILVLPGPNTDRRRADQIYTLAKRCYPEVPCKIVSQSYPKPLKTALGKNPTTGLVALHYFLDRYERVDLHGFDLLAGDGCAGSHYWGSSSNIHRAHKPAGEARIVRGLIEEGRVELLVDTIEPMSVRNPCPGIELPKRLHFVWVGTPPPRSVRELIQRFKKLHPGWTVKLWKCLPDDAEPAIKAAYEGVEYQCQRSDIIRYWVLLQHGGIYVDCDMLAERSLEPLRFIGPVWAARQRDGRINNACMGALPGHPAMRAIIDGMLNVYRQRMNEGFSFPAQRADYGPNLLTRLKAEGAAKGLVTVHKHYFYPLDARTSAHRYWKTPPARRKTLLNDLSQRFVDGEKPFMVHLWGVEKSAAAKVSKSQSGNAELRTVKRHLPWIDRTEWMWPAQDKDLLAVFDQVADIDIIMRHVKRRRVCLQAGGATGIWPLRFSMFFDAVYTFEPQSESFLCLNHNCKAANVYRFQAGLFSHTGKAGLSHGAKDNHNYGAKYIDVKKDDGIPLLCIDAFGFEQVDLIQLDIEGAERDALMGGIETIKRCRPVIVLEQKHLPQLEKFGQKAGDAQRWLIENCGYQAAEHIHRDVILTPPD